MTTTPTACPHGWTPQAITECPYCNPRQPADTKAPDDLPLGKLLDMARNLDSALKLQWISDNPNHAWLGPSVVELLMLRIERERLAHEETKVRLDKLETSRARKVQDIIGLTAQLQAAQSERDEARADVNRTPEHPSAKPEESTVPLLWHAQKMTEMLDRYTKLTDERDALRLRVEQIEKCNGGVA